MSFLERSDSESMAVVMPASFFTRYTLHHLAQVDLSQGAGRATRGYEALGGYSGRVLCKRPCLYVLFPDPTYPDDILPASWSPAEQNPNQQFGLRPSQFFPWNPSVRILRNVWVHV